MNDSAYNKYFFNDFYEQNGGGSYLDKEKWMFFFNNVAKEIVDNFNPKTVLDAGCACGYLVEALRNLGVEAYGIDISEYAINSASSDISEFLNAQSITDVLPSTFPKKFDLVVTIEVLEHLFPEDGRKAIGLLCSYSDTIIFSSTPDDIVDRTHINVQQSEYWAEIFACNSFYRDLIQPMEFICPWAMLFRKNEKISEVIFNYELNIRIDKFNHTQALSESKKNMGYVFFDIGESFSENNKLHFIYDAAKADKVRIEVPFGCKKIRIDPVEGSFIAIGNLIVGSNVGLLPILGTNAKSFIEGSYYFENTDPQIIIDVAEKNVLWIEVSFNAIIIDNSLDLRLISVLNTQIEQFKNENDELNRSISDVMQENENLSNTYTSELEKLDAVHKSELDKVNTAHKSELEKLYTEYKSKLDKSIIEHTTELEKLAAENAHYKDHYNAAINQREELKRQVAEYDYALNQMRNAQFWKITAPARKIVGGTKKILYKNKVTRLFCKGLLSLKREGFKKTWQKVKTRRERMNEAPVHHTEAVNALTNNVEATNAEPLPENIKFSILVPLYNTNEIYLREMIQSVLEQTYHNWELCLADGSDATHSYVENVVKEYASMDNRVKYHRLKANNGISANTNECANMAQGDYIALLDHDDLLSPIALYHNAKAIYETDADVLYSDEDHLSNGLHVNPFYKPDWSPDLLYSQMYVCHFSVIRKTLFDKIGGYRSEFDGSQDYDLMLRISEETNKICHIPLILYTWRECETSTAANADAKPYAQTAGKNALDSHLKRKYGSGAHGEYSDIMFVYDARFDTMVDEPLVSIIIPMKDKYELTDDCIKSIINKSTYQNYEIIILDNRSEEQDTFEWFEEIVKFDSRIKVFTADMEFNWSKLNNFGISKALGEVYIFLNNDTLVITADWIERLCENALRDDIGAVGPLLLYEDDTIQHAGVVVGINGWADHVFKGMMPVHYGAPFVSPMVSRNVLAVTGACMAVSKATIEKIGGFDETFIICGSDVELCIRAHERGLFNRYDANVRLYHLESKSRDTFIPEIDFKRSYECYTPYRENIDPYFNINLDITSVKPKEKCAEMNMLNFKNFLKRCPLTAQMYQNLKRTIMESQTYTIPEIGEVIPRVDTKIKERKRLNLLVPSVDIKHVFGGISTAIKFFEALRKRSGLDARMIVFDAPVDMSTSAAPEGYILVNMDCDSSDSLQIVPIADRCQKTVPIGKNDIFVATGWWTAYSIKNVIDWQAETFNCNPNPLIYFIQDYEPGFYPWSSRYVLADSTYKFNIPTYAIINSGLLKEFFDNNGYSFDKTWYFEPVLNDKLKLWLPTEKKVLSKKKQILIYGRPSVERNAFSVIVATLKAWKCKVSDAGQWTILSAGEQHDDVDLGNNIFIRSVGKLSLEEYANMMLETYAGISLMVSPHPSYPPLEMSAFGIKTITNTYANKNLSDFSDNIISVNSCNPSIIAEFLESITNDYSGKGTIMTDCDYVNGNDMFDKTIEELVSAFLNSQ